MDVEAFFGPGSPFEIVEEFVLGTTMPVFKHRMKSLREILLATEKDDDLTHVILGDRRITFREHREASARIAHLLRDDFGIEPGDRVAILGANSPEWLQGYWGATCAGGVIAALNGWWTAPEIAYGLELVKPKVLIGDRKRLARIDGDPGIPVIEFESDLIPFLNTKRYAGQGLPELDQSEDDPALILFTSGTTGFPKGAVLSHRCIIGFVQVPSSVKTLGLVQAGIDPAVLPKEAILVSAPLFHVSGVLAIGVLAMLDGSKCVLREGAFDPEDALRLIEEEGITSWAALGSAGPRVARHPNLEKYDRSSVTRISFGGGPTSPAIKALLANAFPNTPNQMGMSYGLSEGTAVGALIGGSDYEAHPDAVGRPSPTVSIEIRDERGRALPEGEKGEIFMRSPYIMLEYWDNEAATKDAVSSDRWLATGDVGHFEDGLLYIHSRERDLILRSSENIYPAEIENRLEAHPQVREAAVVGVDHPEHGQEVKAIIVVAPQDPPTELELEKWSRETLAGFKVPTLWEMRNEALPRNASGKVLKTVLTGQAEASLDPDA